MMPASVPSLIHGSDRQPAPPAKQAEKPSRAHRVVAHEAGGRVG